MLPSIVLLAALAAPEMPDWIRRSNEHAGGLLDVGARLSPESAGQTGVEGVDKEITDLSAGLEDRNLRVYREAGQTLRQRLASEKDAKVRQDLQILIKAADDRVRAIEVNRKHLLPYASIAQLVFGGLRALLDDQVAASRRPAALVRLRRYAGLEEGYRPITRLAEERIRERLERPGLLGPFRQRVDQDLANAGVFLDGIGQLFAKYQIDGYQEPLARLQEQAAAYHEFVRKELQPRARTDFRLPAELYAVSLDSFGVDIPPQDLAAMARAAFQRIQAQMRELAPQVAKERGWSLAAYPDVIRGLKKEQLVGDAILPHYQKRLGEIEAIVRRHNLVTLPDRPARIRLATPAESAASPAPNMRPPRLVGNTGEMGEFVLPLNIPDSSGKMQGYDDFTFAAASWTLTAHELRPGHEMQFAWLVEKGVSTARAIYAFNSANVEGWGLYAESVLEPYLPAEGRLIALQHRLMRAARAFLDPELQLGKVTPQEAGRILREEVVLSEAMARQEVERYTFRMPGQATSYFYGYTRLMELRAEVEKAQGPRFDARRFHDFLLAQGLLPPGLLRRVVFDELVTPGGDRASETPARSPATAPARPGPGTASRW